MSKELQKEIDLCKIKLANLQNRLDESEEANTVYNRLLVEKAVLEDRLKKKPERLFKKIKELFATNKEKRICDFFNKH